MIEPLFMTFLFFCGLSLFVLLFGDNNRMLGIAVALPLGVLQWTISGCLMLLCGVSLQNSMWLLLLFCLYFAWYAWRNHQMDFYSKRFIFFLSVFITSFLSKKIGLVQVSFDSVEQIAIGRSLAVAGLSNGNGELLASWGIILPLLQGAGVFLKVDYLASMQPLLWFSLIGILTAAIWRISERNHFFWVIASFVFLVTPYFIIFQSTYIHNSLLSAVYLLIITGSIYLSVREYERGLLELIFLGLIGLTFSRTEAPLFAALAIVLISPLFDHSAQWNKFQYYTAGYVIITISWNIAFMMLIGAGSDIMTPERIGLMIGVLTCAAIIAGWPHGRLRSLLRDWIPFIVIIGSLIAVGIAFCLEPKHLVQNICALASNLFMTGRWGAAWWIVVFSLPLVLSFKSKLQQRLFIPYSVGFVSLVICLGVFRTPYRIGWGDSANRMMVHLFPVIVLWFISALSEIKQHSYKCMPFDLNKKSSMQLLIMGFCLSVSIILTFFLFFWQPVVKKSDIIVHQADGFCPPDKWGRYEFDVALESVTSNSYAAASSSGPRTIILEIPDSPRVRWIELHEYASSESWIDFEIRNSPDGKIWSNLFKYNYRTMIDSDKRIGPTKWRIEIPSKQSVRYIAIDYRESLGQNRLLLRHLKIVR